MCVIRNPIDGIAEDIIIDRPMCKCGYLSEVKLSKDKCNIYFVCSLKNVWGEFFSDLHVGSPCDFWQLYTEDAQMKHSYEIEKAIQDRLAAGTNLMPAVNDMTRVYRSIDGVKPEAR